jgi:hypothetical protein
MLCRTRVPNADLGRKPSAMMKSLALTAALISFARPLGGAIAQTLSATPIFEGNTTTALRDGTTQTVHVSVQSWAITGQPGGSPKSIPLHGFYVAHLLSGTISTGVDGHTVTRLPGDYWTVRPAQ